MSTPVFLSADEAAGLLAGEHDVRVLEVRRGDTARVDDHLPGALAISLTADLSRADLPATAGKRPLPRIEELQVAARRWGLNADTTVLVYDHDGDFVAARAWWVLRWAGVARVSILDGGLSAWTAGGHPLGALADGIAPGTITLSAGHLPELDTDSAARLAEQGRLVDARPATSFAEGHIPGARNISSRDTLDAPGILRNEQELRALYRLGSGGETPGLYCGGGVAGAHGVAVLAHLGVSAPLYIGSFSAWSADPDRPVAKEGS